MSYLCSKGYFLAVILMVIMTFTRIDLDVMTFTRIDLDSNNDLYYN